MPKAIISPCLLYTSIKDVHWPDNCLLVAIQRGARELIPKGKTKLIAGDIIAVSYTHLKKFDPRYMVKNPVMFVVELGFVLTFVMTIFPGIFGDDVSPVSYTHLDVYKRQVEGGIRNKEYED